MSYTVIATSKAEIELHEAFIWYEEIREGLGERFQLDFEEIVLQLRENPFVFQVRYRQYHVAFMKVFPYGVHFRTNGQTVEIISVLHTSRKPRS